MTIGPDERANGPVSTQERFPPEPADRYATPPVGYRTDGRDPLGGRDGLSGREPHPGERLMHPGELGHHSGDLEPEQDLPHGRNGAGGLDLSGLTEPVFSPTTWLDGPPATLADHPLLRGLLLELPPKGTVPPPGWLDRWFEAARSILELLYVQQGNRPR
ncbi:hypothetical protein [Phytohabitans houttuyneae]|uniref:Uncharacterized protein n=1 Tax=Phytohabitans houttuyneae TaxID=1076126 RepID=A0A6V8K8N2_9ACTN|nr:hypothetical protein [Phytohabitans houttuyneae]GFJ79840.1 hypothetical protein Phou_040200 [Phytohabitans houttuyneae]